MFLGKKDKRERAKKTERGACKLTRGALSQLAKYNVEERCGTCTTCSTYDHPSSKCESSTWKRQNLSDRAFKVALLDRSEAKCSRENSKQYFVRDLIE